MLFAPKLAEWTRLVSVAGAWLLVMLPCTTAVAWYEPSRDAVLLPHSHPANPAARAAPPIAVPPISPSSVEEVRPDLSIKGHSSSEPKPSPSSHAPEGHHH